MPKLVIHNQNSTSHQVDWSAIQNHLELVLRRLGHTDTVAIELLVVGDKAIENLNTKFLQQAKPTDVLSFPAADGLEADQEGLLGSIVISYDTALRQAHQAGISVGQELKTLAGHGLLHLLGYHHR